MPSLNENSPTKITEEPQMIDSLTRIQQPKSIWAVKLADRISNLGKPPHYWDQAKKQNYAKEADVILAYLGDANSLLAERLGSKIERYQSLYC
jgi:(p)ppGpp synthase/HD superfamily hydrolase